MSENKLEKSLDEIMHDRRSTTRGRGGRRGRSSGRPAATQAPVGGVRKPTRPAKGNKAGTAAPAPTAGDSKIMISNFPKDVDEQTIKNYFTEMVGKPKKVLLQYGPNGQSLGSAIVIFPRSDLAAKAASELNGVSIDKRPIRVEILLSAAAVPVIPQKTLAERVTSSKKSEKDKPKPATKPAGGRGRGNKRGRGAGGRNTRGPKKTVEELDADMTDYWKDDGTTGDAMATNGGGAVQATTGDTNMDDEML